MRKLFLQIVLCVLTITAYGQTTATYDIVFTSNWEAHGALPNNAHFTRLVGATHNSNITFLEMGGFATPGVELVAELGSNGQFSNEVTSAINANNADQFINGPDLFFNGPSRTITISDLQVDANFPLVTLASMIAPSPDWFVAVNSVSLLDANNQWISEITMDIFPYDAGTEEGSTYSLNNPATNPHERISSLRGIAPFNSQKIGTLVFTRKNIPPAVEGGMVSTTDNQTEVTITVGDGIADVISFATTSTATANYTYIITDGSGNILTNNDVSNDFEPAPAGTCRVYGISYNGDLSITGKNIADAGLATGTYDLSENSISVIREATPPAVEGGMVSTTDNQTEVTITVGDGIADVISFATTSTATASYTYIITDGSGNILTNNDVSNDFEPAPAGTCRVYGISYNGDLSITGKNIADAGLATGTYDLSENSISVIREATPPAVEGGMVSTTDNQTEVTITVGDGIADVISFATTSTATASYTYIITDGSGNILTNNDVSNDFEPAPAGTCRVYGISYNGDLAITGKNIADAGLATGTYDLSENSISVIREATPPAVEGGMVSTTDNQTEVTITVGDGIADVISFATTSTATASYTYIITDGSGNILTNNDVSNDFEPAPAGTCRVYGISYNGDLAITGKNIADAGLATGTYDLSDNSISVIREATPPAVEGGMVSTTDNQTEVTITVGDGIADVISFATTSTATASYTYIITDDSGNILTNNDVSNDFEPAPAGTCRVYGISYNGDLAITGKNIADAGLATGTYDLSDNSISVIREATPTPTCTDGIQNGDETGVDCGGSCEPCNTLVYCESSSGTTRDEYISNVKLGSINNTTAGSPNGYGDYTSVSTSLSKGISNTITITPTWSGRVYSEAYSIWIDYNQDGDFNDNGEQVWTKAPTKDASVSCDFVVPNSALEGNTRMRVSMKYNRIPTPCESFRFGEVEDYTVIIGMETDPEPTCTDGIQNGDETGVDCGGSCTPCDTNDGSVVYVDIADKTVSSSKIWSPFQIEIGDSKYFGPWLAGNSIRLVTYGKGLVTDGNTNNVTLISDKVIVDASSSFVTNNNSFIVSSASYTSWNGKSGYIGFSFKVNGATHYGWFYASVSSNGNSFTIKDYAYNTTAGQGLLTKRPTTNKNILSKGKLSSYPNPFRDVVTIDVSKIDSNKFTVKVFDVLGKELLSEEYTNNPGNISLGSKLKLSGTYFVRVYTDKDTQTLQIIKP